MNWRISGLFSLIMVTLWSSVAYSDSERGAYLSCLKALTVEHNVRHYTASDDGHVVVVPPGKDRNFALVFFDDRTYQLNLSEAKWFNPLKTSEGQYGEAYLNLRMPTEGVDQSTGYSLRINRDEHGSTYFLQTGLPKIANFGKQKGGYQSTTLKSYDPSDDLLKELLKNELKDKKDMFSAGLRAEPDDQVRKAIYDGVFGQMQKCDTLHMDPSTRDAVINARAALKELAMKAHVQVAPIGSAQPPQNVNAGSTKD